MLAATLQGIVSVAVGALAVVASVGALAIAWRRAHLAETQARLLLRDILTEQEASSLADSGFLEVTSPGVPQRIYRIPHGPGRIRMYENGQPVCDLCLQALAPLPASDLIVLHKLMIEGAEERYLATANRFPAHGSALIPFTTIPFW